MLFHIWARHVHFYSLALFLQKNETFRAKKKHALLTDKEGGHTDKVNHKKVYLRDGPDDGDHPGGGGLHQPPHA